MPANFCESWVLLSYLTMTLALRLKRPMRRLIPSSWGTWVTCRRVPRRQKMCRGVRNRPITMFCAACATATRFAVRQTWTAAPLTRWQKLFEDDAARPS